MRSSELQLLVTLLAVATVAMFFIARGLPPRESIHASAAAGDLDGVSRALAWRIAVNAKDRDGRTPLYCAASYRQDKAIAMLVDRGAEDPARCGEDVLDCVQRKVARANREAADSVDGRTWYQARQWKWAAFLVPQDAPPSETPPAGAVRYTGTDRYAVSIERHYRYSIDSLVPGDDRWRTVQVTLKVVGVDRVRHAERLAPRPEPPDGMRVWQSTRRILTGWGRGFGSGDSYNLPLFSPPGSSSLLDEAGFGALEAPLASAPVVETPVSTTLICTARYYSTSKEWFLVIPDSIDMLDGETLLGPPVREEPGIYPAEWF